MLSARTVFGQNWQFGLAYQIANKSSRAVASSRRYAITEQSIPACPPARCSNLRGLFPSSLAPSFVSPIKCRSTFSSSIRLPSIRLTSVGDSSSLRNYKATTQSLPISWSKSKPSIDADLQCGAGRLQAALVAWKGKNAAGQVSKSAIFEPFQLATVAAATSK
jgi:hypothetical protein